MNVLKIAGILLHTPDDDREYEYTCNFCHQKEEITMSLLVSPDPEVISRIHASWGDSEWTEIIKNNCLTIAIKEVFQQPCEDCWRKQNL